MPRLTFTEKKPGGRRMGQDMTSDGLERATCNECHRRPRIGYSNLRQQLHIMIFKCIH